MTRELPIKVDEVGGPALIYGTYRYKEDVDVLDCLGGGGCIESEEWERLWWDWRLREAWSLGASNGARVEMPRDSDAVICVRMATRGAYVWLHPNVECGALRVQQIRVVGPGVLRQPSKWLDDLDAELAAQKRRRRCVVASHIASCDECGALAVFDASGCDLGVECVGHVCLECRTPKDGRPDAYRTKPRKRRGMSKSLRYKIIERDGFACKACGRSAAEDGASLHVDHINPVANGGTNAPENLQALCAECNIGKGARVPVALQ